VGEVMFDQVDGSAIGAELVAVGDNQVYASRTGASAAGMNLINMFTGVVYDAQHFQLSTPDGRLFDLTTTGGLNWVQDANGNTLSVRSTHVSHSDGHVLGFVRDADNRISALRSPDGTTITYAYDGRGDLRATTTAEGFRTRYEYAGNAPHHLHRMIDPEGVEQALFTYDANARLIQSCGAESHCVELQHDLATSTEWFIDGEEELRHTYDARGNVLTETNALNETWTYTYDARDRMLTSVSPLGELTSFTYDRNGNLLSKVEPHEPSESAAHFTTSYTYGALERRTSMTLASGGVLTWEYDGRGNEVAMRDGSSNLLRSRVFDAAGRVSSETNRFGTWQYTYRADGLGRTMTDPLGRVTTLTVDSKGQLTGQREGDVQTAFAYDRDRRPTFASYGNGLTATYEYTGSSKSWSAISGPTFGRVERQFWADGKLSRVTEPNGDVREYYYDANRRLSREHDALGNDTVYERNAAGRVTQIREVATGAETDFTHDAAGRVLTRTDALNRTSTMTYRAGGRLASVTDARNHARTFSETPTSRTVVDALSRTTVRQLSAYGLTTGTSLPGGSSTALSYLGQTRADESQRFPLSVSDEGSRVRSYGYDANGGMTSASELGGQNGWQYSYALSKGAQITWDAESGSVSLVPVDARASAYEFTSQGDLLQNASSAFTGDGLFTSELQSVRTPRGDVTTYERDSSGRPSRVTLPWGAQKAYSYTDADAHPESVSLPQGTTLSFTYDAAKREVSRTSGAGDNRSFVYGPNDRLASMTDATGTTTYEYDTVGRFAGIVYPHGGSVRYVRDLLGRTVRQEVRATASAAPLVTQYAYDEVGNLIEVIDPLGGSTVFVYDAENRLSTRTLPNGVVTTYTYDARDRPLSVVHRNASNVVLVSRTYVRAPGGEPTRITKEDGSYVEIGYDVALRLTSERYFTVGGVLEEELGYTYDADGNRLTKTRNGVVSTYSYAAGSRLVGLSTEGELEARVTDNGGRETELVEDGRQLALTYDSDDHVTRVVDGSATTEFAFDALGRRVGVTTTSGTNRFLTAPNAGDGFESPQAITDASGAVIVSYAFAGEMPLAKTTSGGTEYYLTDANGSVIATASTSGSVVSSVDYDAFGNDLGGSTVPSTTHGDFRLHGMWQDPSGLYFVRARVYDAKAGRFTSRDPAEGKLLTPESMQPYAFAANNPAVWGDPSGLMSMIQMSFTMAGFGVLASVGLPATQHYSRVKSFKSGYDTGAGTWATNTGAGFGDMISFGIGKYARQAVGLGGEVDEGSGAYLSGSAAGLLAGFLQGAVTGAIAGARAAGETRAVIGAFAESAAGLPNYVEVGQALGFARFNLPPSVYAVLERAGLAQWVNMKWLDLQIALGREFVLASNLGAPGRSFAAEVEYLLSRGYRVVGDGAAGSRLVRY
jgi:RHS repeat-associated protein